MRTSSRTNASLAAYNRPFGFEGIYLHTQKVETVAAGAGAVAGSHMIEINPLEDVQNTVVGLADFVTDLATAAVGAPQQQKQAA